MFNFFWNVPPKTYSKAQRKACEKAENYNDKQFPEIELPRQCDERIENRIGQSLDFGGALKVLVDDDDDDEEDVLASLRARQEFNKATDITSADVSFSIFDDCSDVDDRCMAFNSTPKSSSVVGANEDIDDLSTINSEELNVTPNTVFCEDQEVQEDQEGQSIISNISSDKDTEMGNQQSSSSEVFVYSTPVERKSKFLRAKCRNGTPHPMVKLPPLLKQSRILELKCRRNVLVENDVAIHNQRRGLTSTSKYSNAPMKVMNWKLNLENNVFEKQEWRMKFANIVGRRLAGKKAKIPNENDEMLASSKACALIRPKPKEKSSLATAAVSCINNDLKNVREHANVALMETNLKKQSGCCQKDDSSPGIKSDNSIENDSADPRKPSPTVSVPSPYEMDVTPVHPPKPKRMKFRRKRGNWGFGRKRINNMGRRHPKSKQDFVSRKDLDFVKITELLGELKTMPEADDVQTRGGDDDDDDDNFGESDSIINLGDPAIPLRGAKKQLTSTVIHQKSDQEFVDKILKSQRQSLMTLSSIGYEARSSVLENRPTTGEVDSGESTGLESTEGRSAGLQIFGVARELGEFSRGEIGENVIRVENVNGTGDGSAAAAGDVEAENEHPILKMGNDSIEQCWLTEDFDYGCGSSYLEVYKYQTFDPNFSYPQDDLELA